VFAENFCPIFAGTPRWYHRQLNALVGVICDLFDDEDEGQKMANFMWFSNPREIRNNGKKMAVLDNELAFLSCTLSHMGPLAPLIPRY